VKVITAAPGGAISHGEARLTPGVVSHAGIHDAAALSDAISAACHGAAVRPRRVRIALPPGLCTVRPLSLPPLQARELRDAIPWEMERFLPYPAHEAIFGHVLLEPTNDRAGGATQQWALVAAAPRAAIESLTTILRRLGLVPTLLTPRPWAVAAAAAHRDGGNAPVVVDISDDHLFIGQLAGTQFVAVRAAPRAADAEGGRPAGADIAEEIERSLPYLHTGEGACETPTSLWIAGDRHHSEAVLHHLAPRLAVPVHPLQPPVAASDPGSYAAAEGLILRTRYPIDLRSERERSRQRSSLLRPLTAVAPVLTLAAVASLEIAGEARIARQHHELTPLLLAQQHLDARGMEEQLLRSQLAVAEEELALLAGSGTLGSDLTGAARYFAASLGASAAGALHFQELELQQSDGGIDARLLARSRDATAITSFLSALEDEAEWTLSSPSLLRVPADGSTSLALQARKVSGGGR
jgi:hypothetical protein